ncbi:hypothetical protein DIPPA_56176 [Diplonema papillatum]|nr:hypothetical protein DIPPA_56176 [Diplonema papillatum]
MRAWTIATLVAAAVATPQFGRQNADAFRRTPNHDYMEYVSKIKGGPSQLRETGVDAPPRPPPPVNVTYEVGGLKVGIRTGSRAVQTLGLVEDPLWTHNFSFVPPLWESYPVLPDRSNPGAHHLGDITMRIQPATDDSGTSWTTLTSAAGGTIVGCDTVTPTDSLVLDACDITKPIAASGDVMGLRVVRAFEKTEPAGSLVMRFTITNTNATAIKIGAFGMTLPAESEWGGMTTTQVASIASFTDASISSTRSFVTWTRADGSSSLIVTPGNNRTGMEAWRPVLEDNPQIQGTTYEWTVHGEGWTQDWAANKQFPYMQMGYTDVHGMGAWPAEARQGKSPWPEWYGEEVLSKPNPSPWNPPTSKTLAPGEVVEYALRFTYAPNGPRERDSILQSLGEPVLRPVPGYVISSDMNNTGVFVLPPKGADLANVTATPNTVVTCGTPLTSSSGYVWVPIKAVQAFKRARVLLTYTDGTEQSLAYHTVSPFAKQVDNYGEFLAETAWLPEDFKDPFNRGASIMPWDREDKKRVMQDARPFVVGLSDDAGGGNHLGFASKVTHAPTQSEVTRIDDYIKLTLYGTKNGTFLAHPHFSLQDPETDRILMTVYYMHYNQNGTTPLQYSFPENPDYYVEYDRCFIAPSWCAFNSILPNDNPDTWAPNNYRVYNFPHQVNSYYAMYRVARYADKLSTYHPWTWYLERAYRTSLAFGCYNNATKTFTCIPNVGVMDGTVFREVLIAILDEGVDDAAWKEKGETLSVMFADRASEWGKEAAPFGSEFNWDTTGQEECAIWGDYYNTTNKEYGNLNTRVINAILAYTPNVPNWAWHGSSAGWGDFSNNGKWMVMGGWEREGQHYRSGLNSIPLIERYRRQPDDAFLLQTAMGSLAGVMANIDTDGAPSMGFHTHPFIMDYDPHSGDYGLAFFGHALNVGSYVVQDKQLGWLCYLCDITPTLLVTPRDSLQRRMFLEPIGMWVDSRAGDIASAQIDMASQKITFAFLSSTDSSSIALSVTFPSANRPGASIKVISPTTSTMARNVIFVPVVSGVATTVVLQWSQ